MPHIVELRGRLSARHLSPPGQGALFGLHSEAPNRFSRLPKPIAQGLGILHEISIDPALTSIFTNFRLPSSTDAEA